MWKLIKAILKMFGLFLLANMVGIAFCGWQVYHYAHHAQPLPKLADAAVVLGAAAWGNNPSPVFRERIKHGIHLYQTQRVKRIIFTGGTPNPAYPTEAEVARRYAIKQKVPAKAILIEPNSDNTYENLVNTRQIMQQHDIRTIIIVSDPYHLARAAAMAKQLDLQASVSATPSSRYRGNNRSRWVFFGQETLSLFYFYWANLGSWVFRTIHTA